MNQGITKEKTPAQGNTIFHLGLDIGSISINTVLMDNDGRIVESRYDYCKGKPFQLLHEIIEDITGKGIEIGRIGFTGTGGSLGARLIGGHFVNEIVAQSTSVSRLYPEARTVIEMGGEDSKLIFLGNDGVEGRSRLEDFSMNSICAAGTGSFLDQQAKRINVSIEDEFGKLALQSKDPPRIAGRCSVFAKSDMIHLQQIATPVSDIVAGLCFAVARNFKSSLGRGKEFEKPVIFQGGVASNAGMVKAFREILGLKEDELMVGEYHASMGAIGALFHVLEHLAGTERPYKGLSELKAYLQNGAGAKADHPPLANRIREIDKKVFSLNGSKPVEVYLGLDVGSLSTNVVLIDDENRVIARRYLSTAGKPLEAIRKGLSEINEEVGTRVRVKGAGSTGSGRYLTGDFIGADTIRNEIISQATAAIAYDPKVDTIFEIGGQDSKYISLDRGVIVDFEMNKACAAGTGSFLEEQSEKLGINIVEEFADLAFSSDSPARLGNRCTVFMESDLNSHQQKGALKEDLVGGLAYSIVQNYIQKVVGPRRIGEHIFFQGGVTNNKAVVSAFEEVTGKEITVPPHFDVTGAIGVAMLAREVVSDGRDSRFKGFDISKIPYTIDRFTCKGCPNQCEIRRVRIKDEKKPLYYGGRCEKWEVEERKGRGQGIPNLFEERMSMLMGGFVEESKDNRTTIGFPRGLSLFYDGFPFWRTLFGELGFRVVLSRQSDRKLVADSLENLVAETCFPVEVMIGHVKSLFTEEVDFVFAPFVVNEAADKDNPTENYNCPWIQTYPFMVRSALDEDEAREKLLIPTLHFRYSNRVLFKEMHAFLKSRFGIPGKKTAAALHAAQAAQRDFEQAKQRRGAEVFASLSSYKNAAVIFGRPYNTGDPELNLHLVEKLISLDVLPIPMDLLPLEDEKVFDEYPMMYWPNGSKVIGASKLVARTEGLHGIYLSNFRCGADSFLTHFVREEMKEKPCLMLEVDEHSADAGMITRCEAFLDSVRGTETLKTTGEPKAELTAPALVSIVKERTIYFPAMCGAVYALAAAARGCGVPADVLPPLGEEDLELGRRYTSSKECFPMICTTGTFLKKILQPGFVPGKTTFFMPDHNGPCRFGQYRKLQRIIFDRLGFNDVQITSPSNANGYAELSGGHTFKFWLPAWKGIVASDILTKMMRERVPYEAVPGETEKVYQKYMGEMEKSVEGGAKDLVDVMREAGSAFNAVERMGGPKKPVISVVGEIYMKNNPFANGFLVERLEQLGAEVLMSPYRDWIAYFSYRYDRDSRRKRDLKGFLKSHLQMAAQNITLRNLDEAVRHATNMELDIEIQECLEICEPYIHKDYDGEPVLALGTAVGLYGKGVSGFANIFPFTCLPGTFVSSVAPAFRKDHDGIPWVDVAYDGQEDTGIETRLQAFMHQAEEYACRVGYDKLMV